MQHVALQPDAVLVLRVVAPGGVVRVFVALAQLAAEREPGLAELVSFTHLIASSISVRLAGSHSADQSSS